MTRGRREIRHIGQVAMVKQVLKQYKTSRKTQQKDERTQVMELRDAALSIGRPVRDVAPQTGHARRRAVATLPDEQIISGGPWPPAFRTLANDAQVDRLLDGVVVHCFPAVCYV